MMRERCRLNKRGRGGCITDRKVMEEKLEHLKRSEQEVKGLF